VGFAFANSTPTLSQLRASSESTATARSSTMAASIQAKFR